MEAAFFPHYQMKLYSFVRVSVVWSVCPVVFRLARHSVWEHATVSTAFQLKSVSNILYWGKEFFVLFFPTGILHTVGSFM